MNGASGCSRRSLRSRIALSALVLLLSGLLAATLVRIAPGYGADERLLDARLTDASREAIGREAAGQPDVLRFYCDYLVRLAHADFGTSISLGRPVRELLGERLALSARTALAGLALSWCAALALASAATSFRSRTGDRLAGLLAGALLSLPAALVALAGAYLETAPGIAVAAILFPRIYRYVRNLLGQASGAPHVLAAHALGLGRWSILRHHVVAPALPELLALGGASVSMAVGAIIPVEALCDSPGVGQLVWQAAIARDVPVLVNVTLLIAGITTAANLLADAAPAMRRVEA